MSRFAQIMQAWTETAPVIWDRTMMDPDHCLNGSRVTIDALKHFGISAKPLSVFCEAYNAVWWEQMVKAGRHVTSIEESNGWAALGGHSIAIETTPNPSLGVGWPGHLVVIAGGKMLDASTEQFTREARKMIYPRVIVCEIEDGFMDGTPALYEFPDGAKLSYKVRPNDKSYLDMSGFQRHKYNRATTGYLITAMERHIRRKP